MTTSSRSALRGGSGLRAVAVALALLAALAPASASAQQPSAADLESARELYKEAKALRDKGDLRGALEKFKQAHAYGQTPVTALELGKTHMQLGELVEAREVFLSVARMKVQPDETEKSAAARQESADLAEQIRTKIPTLNVKITGVPADAQPQLTIDGAPIPVVSLSAVRKANPGAHVVVAKLGGKEQKQDVSLAEGETKEIAVALDGASATSSGTPPPPPPPGGDTTTGRQISPIVWIGAGVAVVGLGVGTVTGILALGKSSTVKKECSGTTCPKTAQSDVDSGRTDATLSTIGFVAGGVGVAVAAVGWFVLSKPASGSSHPTVTPAFGANWLGASGTF